MEEQRHAARAENICSTYAAQAEYAPASPIPASPRGRWVMNRVENTTFPPSFAKNREECCISCSNLGSIGFKPRNIARNFAFSTTLIRPMRFISPFCCINCNIRLTRRRSPLIHGKMHSSVTPTESAYTRRDAFDLYADGFRLYPISFYASPV